MSRPPILDAVKKEVVCALVTVGASRRRAAEVIGIDESTIRYHLKTDPSFAQRVAQAEVLLEVELMVKLRQQAGRSWKACAMALDRLDRQRQEDAKPPKDDTIEEMAQQVEFEGWIKEAGQAANASADRARRGLPPNPEPTPDANDPTTLASKEFQTGLASILSACDALEQRRQTQEHLRNVRTQLQNRALSDQLTFGLHSSDHTAKPWRPKNPATDSTSPTNHKPQSDFEFSRTHQGASAGDSHVQPRPSATGGQTLQT
jgi:hypothetical protein